MFQFYGSRRTINWGKYLCQSTNQAQNKYLDVLIDASFQGLNRHFVLSFKNDDARENYKGYHLPTVEMKDYNIMIDGRNFFGQPIRNDSKIYENIRKIAAIQGDYTIITQMNVQIIPILKTL